MEKAPVNHRVIKELWIPKKISTAAKAVTPQKVALSPAISPTVEPLFKERNGHIRQDSQALMVQLITGSGLRPDPVG